MFVSAMAQSLWLKVYCRWFQPHSARIGRTPLWRNCAPCGSSFGRRETKREKSNTRSRQGSWSHYTSGSRARHAALVGRMFREGETGSRLLVSCDEHFGSSSLHNDTKIRRIQYLPMSIRCHVIIYAGAMAGVSQNSSQCRRYLTNVRFTTMRRQCQQ